MAGVTRTFELATEMPCAARDLLAWHLRPRAFERLAPPWDPIEVEQPLRALAAGEEMRIRTRVGPATIGWRARIVEVTDAGFVDEQLEGPFASWRHEHVFERLPDRDGPRAMLRDRVTYAPPLGLAHGYVEKRLARTFRFRHATTRADFELARALPSRSLTVVVTGASGLIGADVVTLGGVLGHRVLRAVRREARSPEEVRWHPETGALDVPAGLDVDAIVHLAGEPIVDGRLTEKRKRAILGSRVDSTRAMVARMFASKQARVLVCGSAVGFYGSRGDELLEESATKGTGFLADVCAAWEEAAQEAEAHGARVVRLRTGIVASPKGGALAKMLPAFKAAVGGVLGDGRFFQPWLSVDDMGAMVWRAVLDERARGPINAVGLEAVDNRTFTRTLARVLGRPAALPVPAFALRIALGELADEAVLASTRAVPAKLRELGHTWRHADVESALRHVLGK